MNSFLASILVYTLSSPLFFLLIAVMLKCLLILFYSSILYVLVCAIKRLLRGRLGAKASYYLWYSLLLSLPLSALDFNSAVKLPIYEVTIGGPGLGLWGFLSFLALLWFLLALFRIETHIVTNIRLEGAIALMKPADSDELKNKAAATLGISAKRISFVEADCVNSPLTYGIFRRTVILPRDYKIRYSEYTLYTLLLHELLHIKNNDMLKLHLVSLANCLFLLPPGFVKKFKQDSEIFCDSGVMSVQGIDAGTYGKLLLKECSNKSSAIPGLAFSDSFLEIENRLNALFQCIPEKHNFAVFAGLVFALMFASFVHDCFVPPDWYAETQSARASLDIVVTFADEDSPSLLREHYEQAQVTGLPVTLPDRPGMEIFDGTWEYRNGAIVIDRFAIGEIFNTLERRGVKASQIVFVTTLHNFSPNYKPIYNPIFISNFDLANAQEDDPQRYFPINVAYSVQDYVHMFAAHWL